jgi:hypothetical protein
LFTVQQLSMEFVVKVLLLSLTLCQVCREIEQREPRGKFDPVIQSIPSLLEARTTPCIYDRPVM